MNFVQSVVNPIVSIACTMSSCNMEGKLGEDFYDLTPSMLCVCWGGGGGGGEGCMTTE